MKLCCKLALLSFLCGLCLASPGKPLLVISTSGPIPLDLASGTVLSADSVLNIPAHGQVTLLVLGQGKRLRLTGPCTARWDEAAGTVRSDHGKPEELSGTSHKLQLSGENTRILAGMTTRQGENPEVQDNPWDFEISPGVPGVIVMSQESDEPPGPVTVELETPFRPYGFLPGLSFLARDAQEYKTVTPPDLKIRQIGGRWRLEVPIPDTLGGPIGVKTKQSIQDKLTCYFACVHPWTPEQAQQLSELKQSTQEWADREPDNPEPYVIYAVAAEELGQFEQALQAVNSALKIRQEAGLYRLACRIQMQRGQYASAAQLYRQAEALEPLRKGL